MEEKLKRGRTYLDTDSGAVYNDIVKLTSEKQEEFLFDKFNMSKENKEFVEQYGNFIFKANTKQVTKFQDKISTSDIAKLVYCATYLNYENVLQYENGKKVNKKDLQSIIGVSEKIFYKWYNLMIKSKILIEVDKTIIKMNKNYCIKGSLAKNKDYNRLFINSVRDIYESNKGKNMKVLGHIFTLLPYISKNNNILCWNPNERDSSKIEDIKISDLCNTFSEYKSDPSKLIKSLCKFKLSDGTPVLTTFGGEGKHGNENIIFNPLLTYSGDNIKFNEVYKIFEFLSKKDENKKVKKVGKKVLRLK